MIKMAVYIINLLIIINDIQYHLISNVVAAARMLPSTSLKLRKLSCCHLRGKYFQHLGDKSSRSVPVTSNTQISALE